jgi:flagellar hook assembly protein FlgD
VAVEPGTTSQILALSPCRPNPTSGTTRFEYSVAGSRAEVSLSIYDLAGRRVRMLVKGPVEAGTHRASWDGRNEAGQRERAGVYFYRLTSAAESVTRPLLLTP